jgi:DNA-binding transcriptional LysR family regulator
VVPQVIEQACAVHGFAPAVAIEVAETSTLVSFVAAGLGIALVPGSVAELRVSGAVYRPLTGIAPRVQLGLAWRRDDDSPVLASARPLVEAELMARDPDSIFERSES